MFSYPVLAKSTFCRVYGNTKKHVLPYHPDSCPQEDLGSRSGPDLRHQTRNIRKLSSLLLLVDPLH